MPTARARREISLRGLCITSQFNSLYFWKLQNDGQLGFFHVFYLKLVRASPISFVDSQQSRFLICCAKVSLKEMERYAPANSPLGHDRRKNICQRHFMAVACVPLTGRMAI
jgi:hypothetical protein